MANYDQYDDATLERMLEDATDYTERSAIRQEVRKRKKQRGQQVGRPKKGATGYNRFAGSTAPVSRPPPKNYVFQDEKGKDKPPPSDEGQQEPAAPKTVSPVPRPRSPTPPPTPEQPAQPEPEESTQEPPPEEEEPPPAVSPPPSPQAPAEPEETTDGGDKLPDVGLGEEDTEEQPPASEEIAPTEEDQEEHGADTPKGDDTDSGHQHHSHKSEHESSGHKEPRTLADYQRLAQRSKVKPEGEPAPPLSSGDLQKYLVSYVNQELAISPPMPVRGKSLFDTCSDPTNLCKLINKSVRNTVDLRALTKISPSMSSSQTDEAMQENMTLVIESARAIGCRVDEDSIEKILAKDPETIKEFLIDLIRARVVHLPGMEDEPSSTFENMATLFEKLGISVEETDSWRGEKEPSSTPSPTGDMTYEERAARRKAEREQRQRDDNLDAESSELSYEERAAQRKAEREKRRREREALAQ